ncbi:MAG: 16S rRNA (uracil(1498)-N(3))-methyltransferase [Vicinamibacterales bacterium]
MSLPRFYAPGARKGAGPIALPEDEAHHLTHVLRLGAGAKVAVFDGTGNEWIGQVASADRRQATIELEAAIVPAAEPPVHITLAVGVLKGDQMDAVVRDATALGVAAIVPIESAHVTVPARAWRSGAAVARWQRVAVAAAKQSRRAVLPAIASVVPFEQVVTRGDTSATIMCVEPARGRSARVLDRPRPDAAWLLVGPEGGWSDEEVDLAFAGGAEPLVLGPRTIRAELAPVVALSVLWTRWGW